MAIRIHLWTAILLLILAGLVSAQARGIPIVEIGPDVGQLNLSPRVEYYRDASTRMDVNRVRQLPADAWQMSSAQALSLGFTDAAYWFRIRLRSPKDLNALLQIGYPSFDRIDLFKAKEGDYVHLVTGAKVPLERRALDNYYPLLPFELRAGEPVTIYLRAVNTGAFYLPLRLWDWPTFLVSRGAMLLTYGAYFGVWIIAIVFNLVLFSVLHHRALLGLVLFIFSFGLYQASSFGLGGAFNTLLPNLHDHIVLGSVGVAIISLAWLADRLLELGQTNRLAHRLLQIIGTLAAGLMASSPFMSYSTVIQSLAALTIPGILTVLVAGLYAAINGSRMGLYATLAWSTLLLGTFVHVLNRFAILPTNVFTEQAQTIGFILMVLILSGVIAAEIRRQRLQLLPDEQRKRAELERMVGERTNELEQALNELSDAHETLKELNTVDPVTGIKNRQYFNATFEQEWRRAIREKYPVSILLLDVDHFKQVNDTFGHLAGDECLGAIARTIAGYLKRPADMVARYGGEEFVAVLPYVRNDNALYLAEQIRDGVESTTFTAEGENINLTISIGVYTTTSGESDDRMDAISAVDRALYTAKNDGRNLVRNADNDQTTRSTG